MNANIISKEKNEVKFSFQASPEAFEEGLSYAYNKNKGRISIPGFRKGKAPRKVIESSYGKEVFYDDAINYVLTKEYADVVKELNLDVVSKPEIDVPSVSVEEGITFEATVTIKPEVKLGKYKGLEVEMLSVEVSEDDVNKELKSAQEKNARVIEVSDRAAQLEDIANISYLGTIDGVAFEGGASDGFDLTLGSHSFIDTFEDQIVGHSVGDKFDVKVTFPTEYHDNAVAGKEAVFAIELKALSAKELPELNDEFAQDVSDFETLNEYKESIVAKLKEVKENQAKEMKGDKLIEMVVSDTEMDIPEVMFEEKIDQLVKDFENNMSRQGISLEVYMQYMNTTIEKLRENFKDSAEKNVKARLVLEQIAADEKIEVSAEEIDERIEEIGKTYGVDKEKMMEFIKDAEREGIKQDMLVHKALLLLEENAVEVPAKN